MTDLYILEDDVGLSEFKCDQTVIVQKRYLPLIVGSSYKPERTSARPQPVEWYPFVNTYYPYTEDVDAFARVNHLIANKPSFESLTTVNESGAEKQHHDSYSEQGAQRQYLQSNPVCFLILGKPGIGQQKLGRFLADYWRCVYIDPEMLIQEEIAAGTRAGYCMEFNLKCGRAIGVDVILRLLEKRVRTQSAQHRGFVITGFPLIHNDLYEEDPVSSESAVFTVQEIFEDIFQTVELTVPSMVLAKVSETSKFKKGELKGEASDVDEQGEPAVEEQEGEGLGEAEENASRGEELPPIMSRPHSLSTPPPPPPLLDVGSTHTDICTAGDIGINYEEQLNFIFNQFGYRFILIYVMCPNEDVISKHAEYRYDLTTQQTVDLQEHMLNKYMFTIFNREANTVKELPEEFFERDRPTEAITNDLRYLLRLPHDFAGSVATQLEKYHYAVLSVIERHVLLHEPQYFIKVDGRCTPLRMFNIVKTRLRILPLQNVILPEKLNVDQEQPGGGGEDDDDHQHVRFKVGDVTADEVFEQLRKRQTAGPLFKWTWSNWGVKCPVSMKEGTYKDGIPEFAVSFMNKIFFLNNEAAFVQFCRNPRPFLLPPFPKLSCRILVMGPQTSGKTAVSKCLAYLLNGCVISPKEVEEEYMAQVKGEYLAALTTKAINEAVALLKERKEKEWAEMEQVRQKRVEEWITTNMELLNDYLKMYPGKKATKAISEVSFSQFSSFPVKLADENDTDVSEEAEKTFSSICLLLDINNVPCENQEHCTELLNDVDELLKFLPEDLRYKDKEEVDVHDEFVKEYVDKALAEAKENEYQFAGNDFYEMFVSKIAEIEDRNEEQGNGRGGWIIDGMPPNLQMLEALDHYRLPDDVFILHDDPEHHFLINRFKKGLDHHFDDFRNFFLEIGKTDAAFRAPAPKYISDDEDQDVCITQNLSGLINESSMKDRLERYRKHIADFDEHIAKFKGFLSRKPVTITEFDITDKTIPKLLMDVVYNVDDRYRVQASVFGPQERAQEMADLGEPVPHEGDEPMGGEEGDDEKGEGMEFLQNRRYGDTLYYCPIVFHDHWVLWKGKDEFGALFNDKVYFFSSENALNQFMEQPREYLLIKKPPISFPPPRICVVGAKGSGKTTVAKALAENYGIYYINYYDVLLNEDLSDLDLPDATQPAASEEEEEANTDMIEKYTKTDEALPSVLLKRILNRFWFEDPIKRIGFVLDDFPFRPSDVDSLEENFFIPDIILELSISDVNLKQRNMNSLMENWRIQMEIAQRERDEANRKIMNEWEAKRAIRYKELMEIRRESRYKEKIQEKTEKTTEKPKSPQRLEDIQETDEEYDSFIPVKSQVTFDSVAEQLDAREVSAILAKEMPEPVFEDDFETAAEAEERFDQELEEIISQQVDFIRLMRDYCDAEHMPWVKINAELKVEQVIAQAFIKCTDIKFRTRSCFETTFDISVEISEVLLKSGYYFLSRFGRTCPVQYFEDEVPIQMFLPLEQKYQIFPVLHRQYVYFLAGKSNRDKFKNDPLKYTMQASFNFPLIPAKFAVTGPPKCGKSSLSERFRQKFGMKVITRGDAARYVIEYLPHTRLAKEIETVLRRGWELTGEMVARCVEASAFDPRCVTQGFVLDGFPCTLEEVRHLSSVGLIPQLVFDLEATTDQIEECLSTDVGRWGMPRYSKTFIGYRYKEWARVTPLFKAWLEREYQIMTGIPIGSSKWSVWTRAYQMTIAVFSEVKHYYKHCKQDWPLRLANMQVTPLEFYERRGYYRTFCPCCLHYFNKLNDGGNPPDRTGLVQFRKHFYWICDVHIEQFLKCPEMYLLPYNNNKMPEDLPQKLRLTEVPPDCYGNGVCVVCYLKNLPERVLRRGSPYFAASYREGVYLFDSGNCLESFMRNPLKYFSVEILSLQVDYPSLQYQELPTLGLLEQYVARPIIKALTHTGMQRPCIPGLDAKTSAAICVGLYLKLNNPNTPKSYMPLFKEAAELFLKRNDIVPYYLKGMKNTINPYLHYDEPMPEFKLPEKAAPTESSSTSTETAMRHIVEARRVPVPDERFDYLCEYFKPLSKVPAFLNVVDIAGLVKGASEGQGLGNAFLSHISACDALFHLCRAFDDDDVTHVEGEVNPVRDLDIISEELRLKDEEMLMKNLEKLERVVVRGGDKKVKPEYDTLVKIKSVLVEQKQHIRFADWATTEIEILNRYLFLTSKPCIYLVNLSEKDYIKKKNKWLIKIKEWVDKNDPGATIIPFSGAFEQKLVEFEDPELRKKYLEDHNTTSALDKIIVQGYKALQLEYFFTAGPDEVKAWTIQKGTKAPQAAGRIHTDFEKGFIMAEVMKFNDFKEEGSEAAVKAAGKYRQQGRNYVVEDGDIIFFKFNAGAGLKDAKKK